MLKEGMTLLEQLEDRADLLEENGYQHAPVRAAITLINDMSEDISAMHEDLQYLNKLCLTLMSLLPEAVTAADINKAMKAHGAEVRQLKKGIITDV